MRHYKHHFKDKVVFCNCDDPFESNFFKYFAMNFNHLGLKKLICTCYAGSPVSYTELDDSPSFREDEKMPYKIEITEVPDINEDGAADLSDIELLLRSSNNNLTILDGDGDFRSDESIEFLKESDIVVTNPPFSLFREYMAQLVEYGKSFLILGNQNAISYKEIFPLIKDNKLWLGYHSGHTLFSVPETYKIPDFYDKADRTKLRSNGYIVDKNGRLWRNLGNICWYTNLDTEKRHEELIMYKKYNSEEYPKYDNYDAINADKVADIPYDYFECIGVPITFLDKYNPDQFEIIGQMANTNITETNFGYPYVFGKKKYARILIKRRKHEN